MRLVAEGVALLIKFGHLLALTVSRQFIMFVFMGTRWVAGP